MELNKGFKLTEIGSVPNDWDVSTLKLLSSFISYGFTNPMPTTPTGVYMITARDINHGRINFETARCTSYEAYRSLLTDKSRPRRNDILLTKDGTLGRLALTGEETICINQSVAIIRPNNKVVPLFLKKLLEAPNYQRAMLDDAGGSTIKHIYITKVDKMWVVVPSLKEQEAIANALLDTDAYIESLEKLIAKKRLIKKGIMQELLTGKRRLPEFIKNVSEKNKKVDLITIPFDWTLKTLGEVGDVKMCRRIFNHQTRLQGDIPFYKIGTFGKEPDAYISEDLFKTYRQMFSYPKKGDILISAAGTIGRTLVFDGTPAYFQDSNIVWIDNKETLLTNNFLNHVLQIVQYNTEGGTIQRLYNSILKSAKFACPPTKAEQEAIANVLDEANLEIENLVKNLEKALLLKQGMMQELLTGRIRLV